MSLNNSVLCKAADIGRARRGKCKFRDGLGQLVEDERTNWNILFTFHISIQT